jgi:hypothetical protein
VTVRLDAQRLIEAAARAERELDSTIRQALSLIGDRVVNDARASTKFTDRTSRLRGTIRKGPIEPSRDGWRIDFLAGGMGGVRYAEFVHDGTRPHIIRARAAKGDQVVVRMTNGVASASLRRDKRPNPHLRFVGRGGSFVFRKEVHHPGTAPRPYMLDAIERNEEFAERVIAQATTLAFVRAGFATGGVR